MRANRLGLMAKLEAISPGLGAGSLSAAAGCFTFADNRIVTYNEEVACSVEFLGDLNVAVPADPLVKLLHRLPDEEVEILVEEGELKVQAGKRKAGIRTEQAALITLDVVEKPTRFSALPEDFHVAVDVACQCCGRNDSKYELMCVHVTPDCLESCDDLQLVRYKIRSGISKEVMVRGDIMRSVSRMVPKEFCQGEGWLHFRDAVGMVLSCRVEMDASKYPSLNSILKFEATESPLPSGVIEVANRAEVFLDPGRPGRVKVELRDGKMRISSEGEEGWYKEVVDLDYYGEELKFAISPKLLGEISRKSKTWEIAPGRLRVATDKWTYVTCTAIIRDEQA